MSYVATFSSKGAWRQRVISLSTREPRGGTKEVEVIEVDRLGTRQKRIVQVLGDHY